MEKEDVVSWTAMIAACVQHGESLDALELYWRMEQEGIKPDKIVFVSLIDACSCLGDLRQGMRVHERLHAGGFDIDNSIASGLVNMYRKCGSLTGARSVFNKMDRNDLLSWNALIAGYAEQGDSHEALQVFRWMACEGVKPDGVTFNSIFGAFSSARFLCEGKAVHARSAACGIDVQTVGISLVKMYGQCGSLDDAKAVFDKLASKDVVAWSALIGAHTQHGHGLQALQLYQGMKEEGVKANDITFITLLDACASTGQLSAGLEIHAEIVAAGLESVGFVATALVNMYGKCGQLSTARDIFDRIHPRDVVSCTAMISAYVLHACHREALELYFRLEPEGMKSDRVTFLSVLEACSSLTALEQGRAVHASIVSRGLDSDTGLKNSLINLYGKCGSLKDAESLFDCMRCRDLVTWNSMITTYSHHGRDEISLEVFMQMKLDGIQPNDVTFVSMLFVCSHAGLFEDGCKCFGSITADYSMELTVDHYNCVIDLLGRAGNLDEAEILVANLPEPCSVDWMTLLGACRIHGDADRALRTAQRVAELDPDSLAGKVLLSNIYATARDWDDKGEIFT
ncbi:pentatricopeptide repeat-containing protein At1g11290, chloroplastic isoform X2 [Selaginella moellendorffii]|nr:pentatricopeptide repeat-containing protein At1g11290, chloroplastic isoform X2 [Selaginella moellendorffii]|eukprot:XP_024538865.1 pentatricopeptide repeat-containing protein At1g11290, chloroplastic isoform X2 [Selaginella moellendorffii]